MQFVTKAIEDGNKLVLEAVVSNPIPGDEFGVKDLADKITARQVELQFPEETQQLQEWERAQTEIRSALASARNDLSKHGLTLSSDDTIPAAAA